MPEMVQKIRPGKWILYVRLPSGTYQGRKTTHKWLVSVFWRVRATVRSCAEQASLFLRRHLPPARR